MNTTVAPVNPSELSDNILLFHKIAATTLSITGILVNLTCFAAIVWIGGHRKLSNAFLLSLFVVDFVLSAVTLLSASVQSFTTRTTNDDTILCKIIGHVTTSPIGSELHGVALISLNCYALIVPGTRLRHHFTDRKRVVAMIMTSHLFPAMVLLLPAFGVWGKYSHGKGNLICTAYRGDDHFATVIIVSTLVLSFSILFVTYFGILRAVWRSNKNVDSMDTVNPGSSGGKKEVKRGKARRQLVTSVVSMVISFAILYFPVSIALLVDSSETKWNIYVHLTLSYVGFSPCTVNSLVYTLTNSRLRRSCASLIYNMTSWLRK